MKLLLCLLLTCCAVAQEITVIGAGTVGGGHALGYSSGRSYAFGSAQFGFPLWRPAGGTFSYRFDAIPVSYLREPTLIALDSRALSPQRRWVYGGGANPLALEYDLPPVHRTRLYAEYTAGLLYFSRRVFSPAASQFNFTTALGGGILLHRFRVGYRYEHISNANIANRNPGGDFQLLYFGVTVHAPKRK